MNKKQAASLLLCIVLMGGCSTTSTSPMPTPQDIALAAEASIDLPEGTGDVERVLLPFNDLIEGFTFDAPLDENAYALPANAAETTLIFEGRLELHGENVSGEILVHRGDSEALREERHLPEFDFEFVQTGSYLVPVLRGQVISTDPSWNYLLEPGRIWQENGDAGWARASFPFALIFKGENAIFNGVMSFLFNGKEVSKVAYQITQETTTNTRADFWGLLEASYTPGVKVSAEQVRGAFAEELNNRFPTRPIEKLAEDYPGVDLSAFGNGVSPEYMTWYGFVINGINYVSGCRTRYGQYAYCESMRAASYSTAKSMFASVALMRLAQKYGAETSRLLVKDFVPEAASAAGDWEGVTFDHTLDMATGNYRSSIFMQDEDGSTMDQFFTAQPYAARIEAAFVWPHTSEPGEQWVYHTSDTFIVVRAMHNYLQSLEGPQADIFRFVVDEVYHPIAVSPGAQTSKRTADDNWQGQAEGGYGLWWIPDDIAKITRLLIDQGRQGDVQILQPDLVAAALQQEPKDRGVRINNSMMYNNGFWAQRYASSEGYDCEVWVALMQGYSGNVVAILPNGSVYYYFSDSRNFTWDAAVRESDKIIPYCN